MQTIIPRRKRTRLTHRGRIAIIATGVAAAVATAVAVPLLLPDGPKKPTALTIPEGWRASQVYDAVDKALDVPTGTTKKSLPKAALKLPAQAKGNPEGYLFPGTYPITKKSTPVNLLAGMVDAANKKFSAAPVAAGAQRNAMDVYQSVTIASIVQAESATPGDMGKVARVIYNRLDRGMPLKMDAPLNYALNRTALQAETTKKDAQLDSPYNSFTRMGLPPTPVANPGAAAMHAAISPPPGDWLYFATVKSGDMRFTSNPEEHQKDVAASRGSHPSGGPTH